MLSVIANLRILFSRTTHSQNSQNQNPQNQPRFANQPEAAHPALFERTSFWSECAEDFTYGLSWGACTRGQLSSEPDALALEISATQKAQS